MPATVPLPVTVTVAYDELDRCPVPVPVTGLPLHVAENCPETSVGDCEAPTHWKLPQEIDARLTGTEEVVADATLIATDLHVPASVGCAGDEVGTLTEPGRLGSSGLVDTVRSVQADAQAATSARTKGVKRCCMVQRNQRIPCRAPVQDSRHRMHPAARSAVIVLAGDFIFDRRLTEPFG